MRPALLLAIGLSAAVANGQEKGGSVPELQAGGAIHDLDFRGDSRALFEHVAQTYGLSCRFDNDYNPSPAFRFRLEQADFATALYALQSATKSFIVPIAPKVFMVVADTPEKRRTDEPYVAASVDVEQALTPQEVTELSTAMQQILAIEKLSVEMEQNKVVIRGPVSKVVPARAIVAGLVYHHPQVGIELKLVEVSRNDMLTYGLDLPTSIPILNIDAVAKGGTYLNALSKSLGGAAFGIGALSAAVVAKFEKTAGNSLLNAELRSLSGHKVNFHVGDRYPILTSSYVGGGTNPLSAANSSGVIPTNGQQPAAAFGNVPRPTAVVAADFNRDNRTDVAAASGDGNYVAVFTGRGDGTFQDPVTYAAGTSPSAIAQADLNGDGFIDLVTADSGSNTISILLGNGDGRFQDRIPITVGAHPDAVAITDFNIDGIPDIAVANADSNDLSILLGHGDGAFEAPVRVPVGTSPRALVAADFDGDGRNDLAVVNYLSKDLWVLISNGDGTFRASGTYSTDAGPVAVTAVDLNHDNFMDLVTANSGADDVSVFSGAGDGTFSDGVTYPAGTGPTALLTGDFNLDGLKDVEVANPTDGTVSLLLGLGDSRLEAPIAFHIGTKPDSLASGDFNGDTLPDVLAGNSTTNNLSLLLVDSAGGVHDAQGNSYTATGGTLYSPVPAFNYEDLGLVLEMTPHVHGLNQMTLEIQAEFKLLTGQGAGGLPIIANRKLVTQARLNNGEWAAIAGLISKQDARTISGLAFGPLPGVRTSDKGTSEMLLLIRTSLLNLPPDEFETRAVPLGSDNRPRIPIE